MENFTSFDFWVIGIYFLGIAAIGVFCAKGNSDAKDDFPARRNLGWFSIGLSLFASNISRVTLIGLAGAGFSYGISISNFEWINSVVLIFVAAFFLPHYLKRKITTIPEFLELRFGPRTRSYLSSVTVLATVVIDRALVRFI